MYQVGGFSKTILPFSEMIIRQLLNAQCCHKKYNIAFDVFMVIQALFTMSPDESN